MRSTELLANRQRIVSAWRDGLSMPADIDTLLRRMIGGDRLAAAEIMVIARRPQPLPALAGRGCSDQHGCTHHHAPAVVGPRRAIRRDHQGPATRRGRHRSPRWHRRFARCACPRTSLGFSRQHPRGLDRRRSLPPPPPQPPPHPPCPPEGAPMSDLSPHTPSRPPGPEPYAPPTMDRVVPWIPAGRVHRHADRRRGGQPDQRSSVAFSPAPSWAPSSPGPWAAAATALLDRCHRSRSDGRIGGRLRRR